MLDRRVEIVQAAAHPLAGGGDRVLFEDQSPARLGTSTCLRSIFDHPPQQTPQVFADASAHT